MITMNTMQEAFLKSGIINEEGIIKANKQQENEVKKKKTQEEKEQRIKQKQLKEQERKQKEIDKAWQEQEKQKKIEQAQKKSKSVFDKIYENPQRQKFIIHLLWNYLPTSRVTFLNQWEPKFKKHSCCICNVRVISKSEMIERAPAIAEIFVKSLPQVADGKTFSQVAIGNIREVFKERVYLALSSNDSRVVMCPKCYREFFEWVEAKLLTMDEKVNRIVGRLRKEHSSR